MVKMVNEGVRINKNCNPRIQKQRLRRSEGGGDAYIHKSCPPVGAIYFDLFVRARPIVTVGRGGGGSIQVAVDGAQAKRKQYTTCKALPRWTLNPPPLCHYSP